MSSSPDDQKPLHGAPNGLDLPIRNPPMSGPAVDRLENRKEPGTLDVFTEAEYDAQWSKVREGVIVGMKRLVDDG